VKDFCWKACNNILPTKTNIFHKRVVDNMKCSCCEFEDETILHMLWECQATRDVWGGQASCFHECSCSTLDFKALSEYIMNRFTKEQLALIAVICRRIWLRRNSLIFEGTFLHPNTLEVINAQDEYRRCMSTESRTKKGRTSYCDRRSRWTHPPKGIFKCNWDAPVNVTKRMGYWFGHSGQRLLWFDFGSKMYYDGDGGRFQFWRRQWVRYMQCNFAKRLACLMFFLKGMPIQ
jgi:hypothetical protein